MYSHSAVHLPLHTHHCPSITAHRAYLILLHAHVPHPHARTLSIATHIHTDIHTHVHHMHHCTSATRSCDNTSNSANQEDLSVCMKKTASGKSSAQRQARASAAQRCSACKLHANRPEAIFAKATLAEKLSRVRCGHDTHITNLIAQQLRAHLGEHPAHTMAGGQVYCLLPVVSPWLAAKSYGKA